MSFQDNLLPRDEAGNDGADTDDAFEEAERLGLEGGLLNVKSRHFQRFCSGGWILLVLCLYAVVQSMVVSGLFAANLSSVQKQFQLSSTKAGLLGSVYDMGVVAAMLLVSYYGARHKPRTLGMGLFFIGVGCFVWTLPFFSSDPYAIRGRDRSQLCRGVGSNPIPEEGCDTEPSNLYGLFVFGQILIAVGSTPLYILGPLWLNDNLPADTYALYCGIFFGMSAMGPALGFVLGGVFLKSWVNGGDPPPDLLDVDREWVGKWWLGFILAMVLAFLCCLPFFFYSKHLPSKVGRSVRYARFQASKQSSEEKKSSEVEVAPQNPFHSALSLLKNKSYVFNTLGAACEAFPVSGLSVFLPKVVESNFGVSPSNASFLVGLTLIPGAVGGIVMGGFLVKRFKMSPRQTAKFCAMVAFCAFLTFLGFFIGCDSNQLAGPVTAYPDVNVSSASRNSTYVIPVDWTAATALDAKCNAGCGCHAFPYTTICGADGRNYFSACHAGCNVKTEGDPSSIRATDKFGQCGCFGSADEPASQTATAGYCDKDCGALVPFLLVLFLMMFLTFLNNVPANICTLRCLPDQQQSLGLGLQSMSYRLLGSIPGPLVFGAWIDQTCIYWESKCGAQTETCWEYDSWRARVALVCLSMLPKMGSCLMFSLSYLFWDTSRQSTEGGAGDQMSGSKESLELQTNAKGDVVEASSSSSSSSVSDAAVRTARLNTGAMSVLLTGNPMGRMGRADSD